MSRADNETHYVHAQNDGIAIAPWNPDPRSPAWRRTVPRDVCVRALAMLALVEAGEYTRLERRQGAHYVEAWHGPTVCRLSLDFCNITPMMRDHMRKLLGISDTDIMEACPIVFSRCENAEYVTRS